MISYQYNNQVNTSLKLFLEHTVTKNGSAFTNASGWFYAGPNNINGLYSYYLPYQPIISNRAIPDAYILSGVYQGKTFTPSGVSGFSGFNYEKGIAYFNKLINNPHTTGLSGEFAVADFNFKLADQPEEVLIFETKHDLKPRVTQTITGLNLNSVTYPCIYITTANQKNELFDFGGNRDSIHNFRLLVFTDSKYSLDAVCSIITDQTHRVFPLMTGISDLPYNWMGDVIRGSYNYKADYTGRFGGSNSLWIEKAQSTLLPSIALSEVRRINPGIFVGLVDMELHGVKSVPP